MRPALSNPLAPAMPRVLGMRERDAVTRRLIEERLETILPLAMREAEIDMWLILCQEDDLDPVFRTMMPLNTWCPILQMLVFHRSPADGTVERINLSMTRTQGLFQEPWTGRGEDEQWAILARLVANLRDRGRITGEVPPSRELAETIIDEYIEFPAPT